jgi:hypothetical protein
MPNTLGLTVHLPKRLIEDLDDLEIHLNEPDRIGPPGHRGSSGQELGRLGSRGVAEHQATAGPLRKHPAQAGAAGGI